eukprot:scaffold57810_cov66-Phaeocystis_antarctica.AAC.2
MERPQLTRSTAPTSDLDEIPALRGAELAKFRAVRLADRDNPRPVPSRLMSRLRLANLSYAQLFEFAVDACESSPELKHKADALIAKVAPLPSWCVDVLLSPDLLPQLFNSLGVSEHTATGVCTTWSRAYSRQLRRYRYVDPRRVQLVADVPINPTSLCMLPGGVLAIASCNFICKKAVTFVAARNDSDPQALAACRASSLAARRLRGLSGLALTNDGLLVCTYLDAPAALYKFANAGLMDELATVPVLTGFDRGFKKCAVHQQTQRTYAVGGDDEAGSRGLILLDANLQVVATVETVFVPEEADGDAYEPIRDVAVHGDQVIVLTSDSHPKGSGLRLLDLDGRFLRTIAAGQFCNPQAVATSHGRAFVIDDGDDDDDEEEEPGKVLYIIDIQSGDVFQSVLFYLRGCLSAILVDGDEIYISSYGASEVVVLQLAGSEA